MLNIISQAMNAYRASRMRSRSRYRDALKAMPASLHGYWARRAQHEFKGIPKDAFFFARASEGLMIFFDCVRTSERPCALPSKAADSVWHAWARSAPASLEAFCLEHFGRTIPHIESAAMAGGMDDALAACLVAARKLDRIAPAGPALPLLFTLDKRLVMPGGYGYELMKGEIAVAPIAPHGGRAAPLIYPRSLVPHELLTAGLIVPTAYESFLHRRASADSETTSSISDSGSTWGSGGDSRSCDSSDSSSSSSDSCDSGGSSCGSSCGGGGGD